MSRTLPELIAERAGERPDAVAVRQWERQLTYAELMGLAGGVATMLHEPGREPGREPASERRVAVCVRRRPAAVAAVLGVLFEGSAYVPLDPAWPAARRRAVIEDAAPAAVVVDEDTAELFADLDVPVVTIPSDAHPVAFAAPRSVHPDSAAYVIYTSGSTGLPKGVVVSHRSLAAFVRAHGQRMGIDARDRTLALSAFAFDASVIDLFVPLAAGAEIQLVGEADRLDPGRLQRFIEWHGVSWGGIPTPMLPLLQPDRLPSWRVVFMGGEAPGPEQVGRWTGPAEKPRRRFLNCYGPTEATVAITAHEAAGDWSEPLPIGVALGEHRLHVVDDDLRLVPAGVVGELLVGGPGVARGYLGRAGLTAASFVPDPFGDHPGERLYRTGDLVSRQPDGTLMFHGRRDRQVKVRGQRVELGEIEAVLRAHDGIAHAVVDVVDDALVAYCVPAAGPTVEAIRAHCIARLTAAMVPSRVVRLDRLPLTSSDKVDLERLRREHAEAPAAIVPRAQRPTGAEERAVAAAWARALDVPVESVARTDDFFVHGGHSVAAMRLVASLRAATERELTVDDVLHGRTVAELARRLTAAPVVAGAVTTGHPPALSAAQQRLWFLEKLAPDAAAYNIAMALRLRGALDPADLATALAAVAGRHDVLRWRVVEERGVPTVRVDPPTVPPLPLEELAGSFRDRVGEAAREPFDLTTGPLWRARLFRLAPNEHGLVITFHHAAFDGWSQDTYYTDLAAAYELARAGRPARLPTPPARFADYAAWQGMHDAHRAPADLAWWTEHLAGTPSSVELPGDHPRPSVQTYRGALVARSLSATTTKEVRALAERLGVTPSSVLLATFGELLRRVTGQSDVVLGIPAADRRHPDFESLVGFFVQILPVRLSPGAHADIADAARATGAEMMASLAHSAAPLDRIVGALRIPRDPGRSPLIQVLFNVYNFPEPQLHLTGLDVEAVTADPPGSAFDLTVYVIERDDCYVVEMLYNPDLFRTGRVDGWLDGYLELLEQYLVDPDRPLAAARMANERGLATPAPGAMREESPAIHANASSVAVEPVGDTERAIAAIWCEVLGVALVGATDNFFDVGGHSMALVAVRTRLAEQLGRTVPLVELFQYPNIRSLAAHLDGAADPALAQLMRRTAARRDRARRPDRRRHR